MANRRQPGHATNYQNFTAASDDPFKWFLSESDLRQRHQGCPRSVRESVLCTDVQAALDNVDPAVAREVLGRTHYADGLTVLHMLMMIMNTTNDPTGDVSRWIVKYLLQRGANPLHHAGAEGGYGGIPLVHAILSENAPAIEALLAFGSADQLAARTADGLTPLQVAKPTIPPSFITRTLLGCGADSDELHVDLMDCINLKFNLPPNLGLTNKQLRPTADDVQRRVMSVRWRTMNAESLAMRMLARRCQGLGDSPGVGDPATVADSLGDLAALPWELFILIAEQADPTTRLLTGRWAPARTTPVTSVNNPVPFGEPWL